MIASPFTGRFTETEGKGIKSELPPLIEVAAS